VFSRCRRSSATPCAPFGTNVWRTKVSRTCADMSGTPIAAPGWPIAISDLSDSGFALRDRSNRQQRVRVPRLRVHSQPACGMDEALRAEFPQRTIASSTQQAARGLDFEVGELGFRVRRRSPWIDRASAGTCDISVRRETLHSRREKSPFFALSLHPSAGRHAAPRATGHAARRPFSCRYELKPNEKHSGGAIPASKHRSASRRFRSAACAESTSSI